jgi:hypothetical protein
MLHGADAAKLLGRLHQPVMERVGGTAAAQRLMDELYQARPQESPHLSDRSKNVGEERLLLQHLGEAMHQWAQPVITHGGQ